MDIEPNDTMPTGMHLSIQYPCKLTGIARGKRRESVSHEWRRAEVMLRELPASDVILAGTVFKTRRPSTTNINGDRRTVVYHAPSVEEKRYFTTEEGGLFEAIPLADVLKSIADLKAHRDFIRPPVWGEVTRPNDFREITEDHGKEIEARISKAISEMFVSDGMIYRPVAEPVVQLTLDGTGKFQDFEITVDPLGLVGMHGGFHWYRISDYESAVMAAIEHGVSAEDMATIHDKYEVKIDVPGAFRADTVMAALSSAARIIMISLETSLATLSTPDLMKWAALRDSYEKIWSSDTKDLGRLMEAVRTAMDGLGHLGKLRPHNIKDIENSLARAARAVQDNEALEFTGFGLS